MEQPIVKLVKNKSLNLIYHYFLSFPSPSTVRWPPNGTWCEETTQAAVWKIPHRPCGDLFLPLGSDTFPTGKIPCLEKVPLEKSHGWKKSHKRVAIPRIDDQIVKAVVCTKRSRHHIVEEIPCTQCHRQPCILRNLFVNVISCTPKQSFFSWEAINNA